MWQYPEHSKGGEPMRRRRVQLATTIIVTQFLMVALTGCTPIVEAMPSGYSSVDGEPNAVDIRVCFRPTESLHKAEVVHESEVSVTISVTVRRTAADSIVMCAPDEWIRLELSAALGDRLVLNHLGDPMTNLDKQQPLCETVPALRC